MITQSWPAPAKINLFLHVLGRRSDGYHRLQTVFQFLALGDELRFDIRNDGVIQRGSGPADVPAEQDLVVRAARALQAASGCGLGADIYLDKRIPMGAGLGGGSSDAATTLVVLNHLWGTGLGVNALAELGLGLGADVPVFVRGFAAWAEGVGEELRAVPLPEPWYVVVVPPVNVPTGLIFSDPLLQRDTPAITWEAFLAGQGHNDCTSVTAQRFPQVAAALQALGRWGDAKMSGTGSAVFASFPNKGAAEQVFAALQKDWKIFVTKGMNISQLAAIIRPL